ncbi:MAG TPA: BatD family protein [Marinobacter sp.]|nr:BatD family protein [Marinobacter sp.]
MVKRLISPAFLLLILVSLASALQAEELQVEPDRTQLYEGEVLTLTVTGTTKIDINLSNLFDFKLSDLPSPDIEKVEPDFEILARNQRYSIRTINGDMTGEITWTYQLAPTKAGTLTIPSLTFKNATSKPITIDVISGTAPNQSATGQISRHGFIELSADKDSLYVQEQLVLTIRLFFTGNLIRGDLSAPENPNAIIEQLGKQREFSRYRDGVNYRVVERRYAIFPQQPGNFSLEPIRFEGQARDANGKLEFLRDSQQLFDIPVKDIPPGFTGNTWLPASNLTLEQTGLPSPMQVKTGDNLTRKLTLKAEGLPSEALPPLSVTTPDGLRSYPDQPERSTEVTAAGLESTLTQTTALVPVQTGKMELPEIRIPWWNTTTDSEQVAIIPAQVLEVSAGTAASVTTSTPSEGKSEKSSETTTSAVNNVLVKSSDSVWQWVSLTILVLWFLTMAAWWQSRRQGINRRARQSVSALDQEKPTFDKLIDAAKKASPSTPVLLTRWMNIRVPGRNFRTAAEAVAFCDDPGLRDELAKLQEHLFATGARSETSDGWDAKALVSALERVRQTAATAPSESGLPPLYPKGLSG